MCHCFLKVRTTQLRGGFIVSYDSTNKQKQCKSYHAEEQPMVNGKRTDQCKHKLSLCHIGLVKDIRGRLVNEPV